MKTKTFKIGEYAIGGIIKVQVSNDYALIQVVDWNTKRVLTQNRFFLYCTEYRDYLNYLEEQTSYYFADQITEFICSSKERQLIYVNEF